MRHNSTLQEGRRRGSADISFVVPYADALSEPGEQGESIHSSDERLTDYSGEAGGYPDLSTDVGRRISTWE